MGIILDIIVLAILALSIFLGYKKGLINVVFNLCAFLVAIILTWILYTPITNLVIEKTDLDENIKNTIIEKGVTTEQGDINEEEHGISKFIQQYVTKNIEGAKNDVVKSSADVIAEKTVAIIVAIGLFLAIRIILILLKFIANGIAELPIVKQLNEVGGLVYGLIRGVFVIYLLFSICFIIMSVNNIESISTAIENSIISQFIYNHNIILDVIFK